MIVRKRDCPPGAALHEQGVIGSCPVLGPETRNVWPRKPEHKGNCSMEFGFFAQGAVPKPIADKNPNAEHERLIANLELGVYAEECNFKYTWASEHHFLEEYSHMSTPEVYLAMVAARTSRIHIGSSIMNITPYVNHPFRVAEQVAMLDHLSKGRFEFGTGRGSSTTEMFGFGIENADDTKDMWDESIREFPKMWRETEYSHDGKWFSTPVRNVLPKPYTQPHPPMWVAAGSPSTFEKAAQLGLGVICFSFGPPDRLGPLIETYKKTIENCDPVGEWVNNNVMCVTNLVCLEDRDDAFKLGSEIGMSYYHSQVVRWLDSFPRPKDFPVWPEVLPEPTPAQLEAVGKTASVIVGDPDDCAEGLRKWESLGADILTFSPLTTQISLQDAKRVFRTFGEQVIPKFDPEPELHSTTKQRIEQTGK